MGHHKDYKKTGRLNWLKPIGFVLLACLAQTAQATEPSVTAELDRNSISAEESVSLKISVQAEGNVRIGKLRFNAPDFDVINEYESSHFQSYYENGKFGTRSTQVITKVLRPTRIGALKISDINIEIGSERKSARDLMVEVTNAGAGAKPPKNYGGAGVGLRGSTKNSHVKSVFLRAEPDKTRVYKGEQIVVSYYLYSRVRMFEISATKFPEMKGFLKEELEMPLSGARLESERIIHEGVPYERSLLVRYAAYPLQEGKLQLDPLDLKYAYTPTQGLPGFDSENDPFLQFFQSMTPREGRDRSETITIEVLPLPEEGRPASFTNGVGDFNITAAVDKYSVRANEAITLTVKIEGRGNVSAIAEPKAKWPDALELYDSKGRSKLSKGGVGEKVFEFLLIPRTPGPLQIPELEFSFFDSSKKHYITKKTEPFAIQVLDPAPGQALVTPRKITMGDSAANNTSGAPAVPSSAGRPQDLRYLLPPSSGPIGIFGNPLWRWLYWAGGATLLFLAGLVLIDSLKNKRILAIHEHKERLRLESKSWDKLRTRAGECTQSSDVLACYERIAELLLDALEQKFPIGVRGFSRADLQNALVTERGFNLVLWERISKVLEHADYARFGSSAQMINPAETRSELLKWADEGYALARILEKDYKPS